MSLANSPLIDLADLACFSILPKHFLRGCLSDARKSWRHNTQMKNTACSFSIQEWFRMAIVAREKGKAERISGYRHGQVEYVIAMGNDTYGCP